MMIEKEMTDDLLCRFEEIHAGCPWHKKQVTYYRDGRLFCNLCPFGPSRTTRIYWYSYQPTVLYKPAQHKGVQYYIQNSKKVVRLFPWQQDRVETLKVHRKRCANCYSTVSDLPDMRFCSITCQRNVITKPFVGKETKRKGTPTKSPSV